MTDCILSKEAMLPDCVCMKQSPVLPLPVTDRIGDGLSETQCSTGDHLMQTQSGNMASMDKTPLMILAGHVVRGFKLIQLI